MRFTHFKDYPQRTELISIITNLFCSYMRNSNNGFSATMAHVRYYKKCSRNLMNCVYDQLHKKYF